MTTVGDIGDEVTRWLGHPADLRIQPDSHTHTHTHTHTHHSPLTHFLDFLNLLKDEKSTQMQFKLWTRRVSRDISFHSSKFVLPGWQGDLPSTISPYPGNATIIHVCISLHGGMINVRLLNGGASHKNHGLSFNRNQRACPHWRIVPWRQKWHQIRFILRRSSRNMSAVGLVFIAGVIPHPTLALAQDAGPRSLSCNINFFAFD